MTEIPPPLDLYPTVDHAVEGLHLEANEHHESLFQPPAAHEMQDLNCYPDSRCTRLAESLASFLGVMPNQLYFTNGSIEAIEDILVRAVHRGGTRIGTVRPSYELYRLLALRNGLQVRVANLDGDDLVRQSYAWEHYLEQLNFTDLCIIGSPNNPTGTMLDRATACDILENYDGELLVDEAYIEYAGYRNSLGQCTIDNPRLLVIRTFSKAWGLAAIRLGYIIGHPDTIDELKHLGRPYRISTPTQAVAINALNSSIAMIQSVHRNNQLRSKLARFLRSFKGVAVLETRANFVLVTCGEAREVWSFLGEQGIFVRLLDSVESALPSLRIAVPDESGLTRLITTMSAFFESDSRTLA